MLKSVLKNRELHKYAKKYVYEGVTLTTVLYGVETSGTKIAERRKVNVLEMNYLRSIVGVTLMDRVRNEEVHRRDGIERELEGRVDQRMLRSIGHVRGDNG